MSNQTITAVFDSRGEAETAARDLAMKVGGVRAGLYASQSDAGTLRDLGISGPDQAVLEEAIRRGGAVLSATVPEDRMSEVTQVLESAGAVDLNEREDSWRQSGWQGSGPTATKVNAMDTNTAATGTTAMNAAAPNAAAMGSASAGRDEVIPVVEETLRVGKRQAAAGRVRVHAHIVETPVQEQVTLHHEHVQVERRPVSRPVDVTADAFRDRTIEATETTEEAVVSKEARVVEEIVVRKTGDDETRTISDSVRRTEVEVEDDRLPRTGEAPGTAKTGPARER